MIVSTRGSVLRLLLWQWRNIAVSTALATTVCVCVMLLDQSWMQLPSLPLAVVGAALGIFVSFRTNSSYDRWWEGRKLWGLLINTSRHIALEIIRYLPESHRAQSQTFVRRQIAYVHTLRCLLRTQDPLQDDNVLAYLSAEEKLSLQGSSNATNQLLDGHFKDILRLNEDDVLDDFRLQSLDQSIRKLLDIQGGCERIKKTPLPRPYSFMSERMIQWFGALLPCALVGDLGWGAIPVSVLVVLGFQLISETGRVLEDPFSVFWNGLPLSSMSRTIEINLLELLGETDLPEPHPVKPAGVLM